MITRTVLVISTAPYFRGYTWQRGGEMITDHPYAKIKRLPSRVVMACDFCMTEVVYLRVSSAIALRGMAGPVEVVQQELYNPRDAQEIYDAVKIINDAASEDKS